MLGTVSATCSFSSWQHHQLASTAPLAFYLPCLILSNDSCCGAGVAPPQQRSPPIRAPIKYFMPVRNVCVFLQTAAKERNEANWCRTGRDPVSFTSTAIYLFLLVLLGVPIFVRVRLIKALLRQW